MIHDEMKVILIMKIKRTLIKIVVSVVVLIVVFVAGTMYVSNPGQATITSTGLTQTLQEINEMAVMQYNYTKIGKFTNSLDINGWTVPLTQKSFLITYNGKLKAGIDMNQISIEVSGDTITATVPQVEVLSNEIDENSIEVYDEKNNLFNPISISDYKTFATQQKDKVEQEAIENGLLEEAAIRVELSIKQHLNMIDTIRQNYEITVEFAPAN